LKKYLTGITEKLEFDFVSREVPLSISEKMALDDFIG